jgi:hypothetical protein
MSRTRSLEEQPADRLVAGSHNRKGIQMVEKMVQALAFVGGIVLGIAGLHAAAKKWLEV